MDNQNHCMTIKQARLVVNAHKHKLSFLNDLINFNFKYVLILCIIMTDVKLQSFSLTYQINELNHSHLERML